jgi:exportin-7
MHQPLPGRTATQHRKTAVSFRDVCLLDMFTLSLEALRRLKDGSDTTIQKQVRMLRPW